jgi:hypothetical protein
MKGQPHQQTDLRQAGALIERYVSTLAEIRRAADNTKEDSTEDHLREILGTAGLITPESKG